MQMEDRRRRRACASCATSSSRQVRAPQRLVDDLLDVGRIASGKVHLSARRSACSRWWPRRWKRWRRYARAQAPARGSTSPTSRCGCRGPGAPGAGAHQPAAQRLQVHRRRRARTRLPRKRSGDHAELRVRDNGRGIAPEQLHESSSCSRRSNMAIRRRHGGLGIGLSLVHQMVRCMAAKSASSAPASRRGCRIRRAPAADGRATRRTRHGQRLTPFAARGARPAIARRTAAAFSRMNRRGMRSQRLRRAGSVAWRKHPPVFLPAASQGCGWPSDHENAWS